MAVQRAEHLQEGNGRRVRLNALTRTVRLIHHGYSVLGHGIHIRAMRHKVENHLIVPSRSGIV